MVSKRAVDPRKIRKTVENYIETINSLLTRLEQEKRRVESQAVIELREIEKLLNIERNVNSPAIRKKLLQLSQKIANFSSGYASGQRRGVRGRSTIGYILKKISGKRRILADSRKRLTKTQTIV